MFIERTQQQCLRSCFPWSLCVEDFLRKCKFCRSSVEAFGMFVHVPFGDFAHNCLVAWNIFYFFHIWREFHHPNWLSYFSDGVTPPIRQFSTMSWIFLYPPGVGCEKISHQNTGGRDRAGIATGWDSRPSRKPLQKIWKDLPCTIGKSTISMAMFQSYVSHYPRFFFRILQFYRYPILSDPLKIEILNWLVVWNMFYFPIN